MIALFAKSLLGGEVKEVDWSVPHLGSVIPPFIELLPVKFFLICHSLPIVVLEGLLVSEMKKLRMLFDGMHALRVSKRNTKLFVF